MPNNALGDERLQDAFGRTIDYLRISVTDRCNLRCVYCMPPEGVPWLPHAELLSYEEIARVVRCSASLGMRKVRLTGGEPLVRPHVERLVKMIADIPGICDLSMTSNAVLLSEHAQALKAAGLRRVNISLDSLRPERFRTMTRLGDIEAVWRGLHAAEETGLLPIKLNVVVVRGLNDDELVDFARLTLTHDWHVRFIELMPLANGGEWGKGLPLPGHRYVPADEIQATITARLGAVPQTAEALVGNGPAAVFRLPGARGTLGFISPVSRHFCPSCNRLRLTSDGKLRPCLLSGDEIDVRAALRAGASDEHVRQIIAHAVSCKPERHRLEQNVIPLDRTMAQIGG
ncbi:MAG: GTP 3',8-cyclase MoaA [Thermoflexales bacterium]|nr:GTP 3',8-cyclase MoaA [Thermoflexales bacterium]